MDTIRKDTPRIYTSGQRYGIITNKWNLREFDRYLLFLVVCSIAERNTVDFIDPLRNQIEWSNTVSIVWGPQRLKRRKKVSSGVVTWSEVCLVIGTLMLLCSVGFRLRLLIFLWTFKGNHASKFATANTAANCQVVADGNSQREVVRILGVSQRCISKLLRCNRETGRSHQRKRGGSMKISTQREDRQLLQMVRTHCFISAPRLRMQMIRRFGRRLSVRTIRRRLLIAGYWSRRPAICPRLTLEHRRRRRGWGRRHRVRDLKQWRHCVFSDESRFSLYHSDGRVRVRRRQGERLIDACVQPNDGNRGPSVMAWNAIHHGGRSELVVVDGAMNRQKYIQILRNQMLPWATGVFGRNFVYVQDHAPPHTARDTAAF